MVYLSKKKKKMLELSLKLQGRRGNVESCPLNYKAEEETLNPMPDYDSEDRYDYLRSSENLSWFSLSFYFGRGLDVQD